MQGGFSIREYVARMRSVNVVHCWPFDQTTDEETVKSLLPPITVQKFTWWLDELEFTHPDSPLKSPKKKKKGDASKLKAPKKRSIVEIFAVAPPVERVTSGEEEEENGESSFQKDPERRKKKKKKKSTNDTLRVLKKIKKRKKLENGTDQSDPNKDNSDKLKLQVEDKETGKSSSSQSKDLESNIRDCVPILKRKPNLQNPDEYNRKTVPCEENQRPGFPVRGILKNNGDVFPVMKCVLQEAIQENQCSTKMANKHVTFSEKDETIASIRIDKEVDGGLTCIDDPTERNNEEEHSRMPKASERSQDWSSILDGYYNSAPSIEVISNSTFSRPRPVSPPLHFEEYMRTHNEPHLFDNMDKRNHTFSAMNNALQFQSLAQFSSKDFVGLPLNSQGELIRSNSRDDFNQMMNPTSHSNSLSLPRNAHSELGMNQLNLFPEYPIPSRLGLTESQSERNMDFLDVNHCSFNDSDNSMWRGDKQVHRSPENQSTMRLMGKDFTVGGSEDGHIWKDKQIVDQSEPSLGKFRETLFFPSDSSSNYAMYPSVFAARKTEPLQKIYPGTNESRLFQEACPYVNPTPIQQKASISAIRFPFLHPDLDLDERARSSWSHRSVTKEKETLLSSSSRGNNHHQYLNPGTSHSSERDDYRIFFPMSASSQTSMPPPYYPGGMLMQKRYENQKKFKERTKFRIGKGSKSSTVPFKPFKMPILGPHGYTQCGIRKPTAGAFGSYPAMNKSRFAMCGEYEANRNEQTISRWIDSARTAPVKLSGGAKHILKSSTSIDQEISLSTSNMDFRFSESENSAKTYRNTPVFDL